MMNLKCLSIVKKGSDRENSESGEVKTREKASNKEDETTADSSSDYSLDIEAHVQQAVVGMTGQTVPAQVEQVEVVSSHAEDNAIVMDTILHLKVTQSRDRHADVQVIVVVDAVLSHRQGASSDLMELPTSLGATAPLVVEQHAAAPFQLDVNLTHAFSIHCKAASGPNMGESLVMLTMRHTDTHAQDVVIWNIAMHPGHSISTEDSLKAKEKVIVDMTPSLTWKYMDGCEPQLPLTIKKGESYATILALSATGDTHCRRFVSPLSVTAAIQRHMVLAAAEVRWISSRALVEPANAFRVDMRVLEDDYPVGAPMVVPMTISNLSGQLRNISISVQEGKKAQHHVLGTTEDGKTALAISEHHTDLLSIDRSFRFRDVPPHGSVNCEWRFTPLKAGVIDVPNFRLVDVSSGQVFFCVHNTRIVGQAA